MHSIQPTKKCQIHGYSSTDKWWEIVNNFTKSNHPHSLHGLHGFRSYCRLFRTYFYIYLICAVWKSVYTFTCCFALVSCQIFNAHLYIPSVVHLLIPNIQYRPYPISTQKICGSKLCFEAPESEDFLSPRAASPTVSSKPPRATLAPGETAKVVSGIPKKKVSPKTNIDFKVKTLDFIR